MKTVRQVEIFSAGCQICKDTVALVKQLSCPSCEITFLDMNDTAVADRAKALGIRTIPALVVDGQLAKCCAEGGLNEQDLRAAGIGMSLS